MSKWDLISKSAAFSDCFNYNAPYVMLLFEQSYDEEKKGLPQETCNLLDNHSGNLKSSAFPVFIKL